MTASLDIKIEIRDLTMAFGSFVVMRDINAQVKRGEVFIIMGASGCGKSTLLRHMIGLKEPAALAKLEMVPNDEINPFFRATIDATEEAVVNAMLAAPPVTTGADGLRAYGLPPDRLVAAMKKYGRMK